MLGVLAAVNPCGFAMLPNYLVYFLGIDDPEESSTSPVRRSLKVGLSVSYGFLAVFLVVGVISRVFTQWIEQNAKYAALAIGIGLVFVGIRMLFGWKPRFATPHSTRQLDRTSRSMFIYGVISAVASIGCTIGFLTAAIWILFDTWRCVWDSERRPVWTWNGPSRHCAHRCARSRAAGAREFASWSPPIHQSFVSNLHGCHGPLPRLVLVRGDQ